SYVDRDRRYRFVNRQYETWFDRTVHDIQGRSIPEVMGEAAYAAVREHVDQVLAGREVTFGLLVPYLGAGNRWIQATYRPHVLEGEVQGFVAFVEDVTERKRAEDALRLLADAGELLSNLGREETLDNAARLAVPVLADWCTIDLMKEGGGSQRIVSVHADPHRQSLMEELKLYPPAWDGESTMARVLRTGEPALLPDLLPELIAAETRSAECAQRLDRLAPCSALCVPLTARGRKLGVWTFVYAESGRRYREENLRVAQELARRVALALDNSRLYRELETANRAKDHFLATLSHELRTPLTPVLAIASRLGADHHLPASVQTGLDTIRRNVELEARLIDDLLDLTRVTRGKLELHREPTDLRQVVHQALGTCNERELEKRHAEQDLAAPEHCVWGDPSRLAQVFWNLLNNAIKFTPAGGTIHVRSYLEEPSGGAVRPNACHLIVEVSDSGIGIEPDALPHIFDAFDQGQVGITRRFGGLGLGLAISRAIVELHGGRLTATSEGRDKGAAFTVRLPLERPPAMTMHETSRILPDRAPDMPPLLHILLVEDHGDTAEAMAGLLTDMGHHVSLASTIATALAMADQAHFDLLVSDLGLPDGHGCDLMRTLVSRHGLRGIAISGYGMEEDIARSLAAGFALHVTKPVTFETLRTALEHAAAGR
ncbi:MAG: ATP-binding protein, partial [Acidobacteriota bacterium]|nr:ATP-binding protein [Acidobacteriota bacterium]